MQAADFITKWEAAELKERSASQAHFLDLCALLGIEDPVAGVTKNNLAAMKLLGIDRMKFATSAQFISTIPDDPTIFESTADFALEEGTMMPPLFGDAVPIDTAVEGDMFVTARMHKEGDAILGLYSVVTDYWLDVPGVDGMKLELDMIGDFTLKLIT